MPHAYRTGDAHAAGISRRTLRGPLWEPITHGVHGSAGLTDDELLRHIAMRMALPPDAVYAHVSGAALLGWPLPWLPQGLPVMAATKGTLHAQREGVYLRRVVDAQIRLDRGLPTLDTPDLLCDLARDFELVDLVPVVDAALQADGLEPADIARRLRRRAKGRPRLLAALELADPRSESFWESVLRLVHQLGGIPQVEPQVWIGDRVARGDLWLVGTRRIVEYDGVDHDLPEVRRRDIMRDKQIRRIGWERYPYIAGEIVHTPGRILTDAEEALGLAHDPDRLNQWLGYARVSTLTSAGKARLAARLGRYQRASERHDRPRLP